MHSPSRYMQCSEWYAVCLASMHSFYRIGHTRSSIRRNFPWNVQVSLPTCNLAPMTKISFYVSSFSIKFNFYSSECNFTISLSLSVSLSSFLSHFAVQFVMCSESMYRHFRCSENNASAQVITTQLISTNIAEHVDNKSLTLNIIAQLLGRVQMRMRFERQQNKVYSN